MILKSAIAVLAMTVLAGSVHSAPLYDPSPFGINALKFIHGTGDPNVFEGRLKAVEAMKNAGIHWDRLELWWGVVEPEQGKFDWSYTDKIVEFYLEHEIDAIVLLCYHSAWSGGNPPRDADERARYANFVYEVVNRYKDHFKIWQIWNEPNIPTFWPQPDVELYTLLLKEASEAAKRADPEALIIAATTSGPDLGFVKGIHRHGGWDHLDIISIQPYSMAGGPVNQRLDKILRMTNDVIADTGKPKALWITELGWMTPRPDLEELQAISLVQSYAKALANGVEKLFWFDLSDWAEKWGIMKGTDPFEPKPSYIAYQTLTSHLGSPGEAASFMGYLRMPEGVAAYVFGRPDGERILLLWSNDEETRTVRFSRKRSDWQAVDMYNNAVDMNGTTLAVGPVPIWITGAQRYEIGIASPRFNPYLDSPGDNLINNASFEIMHGTRPGWWDAGRFNRSATSGTFNVSDQGRTGGNCVSISESGERAAWDAALTPVEAGKTYRVTAWMKTEDATGDNRVSLFWYSGNQWTYQSEASSVSLTGTNDWTQVSAEGVVPDNAVFVRVNLISENNTGTTWFDDVKLVEVAE